MTPRTATKLGWWSFALAAVPVVLIVVAVALYVEQPSTSGAASVGWIVAMMGSLFLLAMATYVIAPISIALGGWALVASSRVPTPNRARVAAVIGIFLSILTLASVATGHAITLRRAAAMSAANAPTAQQLAKRVIVEGRVERLVAECRAYAAENDDRFPQDMGELAQWCQSKGRSLDPNRPQDFEYYGAGAKDVRRDPTADDVEHASRLILFFEKVEIVPGARVIGIDGASAHTASAISVQETDLPALERASNEERARRGMQPARIALTFTN
jgi:hypothetical protein